MISRVFSALAITLSIPVIGYLVAIWILSDINSSLEGGLTAELICEMDRIFGDKDLQGACDEVRSIVLLRDASIWSGAVALGLMAFYAISAAVAGGNRRANAFIFPKVVPVSTITLAGLVLVEGAILTYAVYLGESYAIGRVHIYIIGAIGIGALYGGLKLAASTFSFHKKLTQKEFAKSLDHDEVPTLWAFVEEMAASLSARVPNNIIVGLEPNFYATAADVRLINEEKTLRGETLFLSLPIMRLFDKDELRAVVGHELGHFRGEDTAYSLRFAPVYRGLSGAVAALRDEEEGASALAKLPAAFMLSAMLEMFARNERRISREREFEADKAGVSVSSKDVLASALGKVAVYAPLWSKIRSENIDRLSNGKVTANLSQVYQDSARFDISHANLGELMEEILATRVSHPVDTHPTLAERFDRIGVDASRITVEKLTELGSIGPALLSNISEIEQELTLLEHQLMVAVGQVSLPDEDEDEDEDEEDETDSFLNAMYFLAAAMVGADGNIEQNEVVIAEQIGSQMFSDFDPVEFRSCCNNLSDIPSFQDCVGILTPILKLEHKTIIYDYLKQIALADGELADEEKELLTYLRNQWVIEI